MNWSDERYVRLFTRDTVTWLKWSFETRSVFMLASQPQIRTGSARWRSPPVSPASFASSASSRP